MEYTVIIDSDGIQITVPESTNYPLCVCIIAGLTKESCRIVMRFIQHVSYRHDMSYYIQMLLHIQVSLNTGVHGHPT